MTTLPTGVATGIGSMPGADPREAAAIIAGELALPHLPELPARGVGADLIGRTAALLIDIPVDHVHRTYRLASTPTSITRRARDFLRWDVDALEEQWEIRGLRGEVTTVKVQACGPFTFAAHAELRGGHKIIRDRGAVRDVAASLAAGVAEHAAEVERRLGVNVVVQLDEPSIGEVIDGTVTPLTRLDPIAPIAEPELAQTLETMAGEIGRPMILHSCAAPRWELLSRIPSFAPSLDLTGIGEKDYDALGGLVDSGRRLVAGIVPVADAGTVQGKLADDLSERLTALFARIGLPASLVDDQVLISPVCGLAGAGTWAKAALSVAAAVAAS